MMPTPPSDVKPAPGAGVVDAHFHAFPLTSSGAPGARYVPAYAAPLADWVAATAPHGVTQGVLVQPSFLGTDNTHLLRLLAEQAGRLRGVVVVAPDIAMAELERMQTLGVRGVRLNLVGGDHRLGAEWHPLFERLERLDWHVQVHTDHGRLSEVLARIPQALTVVADHFGKPAAASELEALAPAQRDRLHVKLSAPYRLAAGCEATALLSRWRDLIGPGRLMWGSDWPCTAHEQARDASTSPAWLEDAAGTSGTLEALQVGNARRLYRF